MQALIIYCRPGARFHFGKIAPGDNTSLNTTSEWAPSDTLFSAVANNIAAAWPSETNKLLKLFENGNVRISSGFYLLDHPEGRIFFLPKPAHYAATVKDDFKIFGKVKLISKTVWEKGWQFADWEEHCLFLQDGEMVVAKSELPDSITAEIARKIKLFELTDYPRVKVHTHERENNHFYVTAVCLADNNEYLPQSSVHLYCLIETAANFNADTTNVDWMKIATALHLLPHQGIGGEIAGGFGLGDAAYLEPFTPPQLGHKAFCSVALTLPNSNQIADFQYYQVVTRGGRKFGGPGKQFDFVRMLAEGAYACAKTDGSIVHIGKNNNHTVWRYGKAFWLETHPLTPSTDPKTP